MTYPSTFFQNRRSFDVPQSVKCSDLIHMLSLMFATETDAGLSPAHCRYLRQRLLSKRVTLFLMADSILSLINTMGCASLLELFQNKARINVVSVQLTDLFARMWHSKMHYSIVFYYTIRIIAQKYTVLNYLNYSYL